MSRTRPTAVVAPDASIQEAVPESAEALSVASTFTPDAFVENFDTLAASKGGIRRMRELAIELAVRGLLLDDPRSMTWKPVLLSDVVADFQNGISKRRGDTGDAVPVLRLADIVDGSRLRNDALREIVLTLAEQTKYRVHQGDVLVIRVNGSADLVGRFVRCDVTRNWAYSDHLIRLRLKTDLVDPAFLGVLSRSAAARAHLVAKTVTSAGQRTINQAGLGSLPFALPPLAEQKRIVVKVDQLMAVCDDLEAHQAKKRDTGARFTKSALQALTSAESVEEFDTAWKRVVENFDVLVDCSDKVEELRAAILSLAMRGVLSGSRLGPDRDSEPHTIPAHWKWRHLADVVASITDGDHQPPPRATFGVAFLTIGNVSSGRLDFSSTRFVPQSYFDNLDPRRVPTNGDILYTVVGATYGRPVRVDAAPPFCVQRHIAIVRPNESCDRDFVYWFLRSPLAYSQATASITGTAQPTVALGPLRRFLIPVPPMAEQRRITIAIESLMQACDSLAESLVRTEACAVRLADAIVRAAIEQSRRWTNPQIDEEETGAGP